jgi:hypothetical protein
MNPAEQVFLVLQLILVLGPLAVYFLALGLVNSLARPCLINARVDFVLLTVAFVPILLVPTIGLVQGGHWAIAAVVLAVCSGVFLLLLPPGSTRWVLYNCGFEQSRRLIVRAARKLGCHAAQNDDDICIASLGIRIHLSAIGWLRNVSLCITTSRGDAGPFLQALQEELSAEAMLPSPAGASLVLIGTALLGVPMWYLLHHMDAVVDVVRHILFA